MLDGIREEKGVLVGPKGEDLATYAPPCTAAAPHAVDAGGFRVVRTYRKISESVATQATVILARTETSPGSSDKSLESLVVS